MPVFNYSYDPSVGNSDLADTQALAQETLEAIRDPAKKEALATEYQTLKNPNYQGTVDSARIAKLEAMLGTIEQYKTGQPDISTIVKDLRRAFKMPGYDFARENEESVKAAVRQFQNGTDEYQQVLMGQSQGLLQPLAGIVGAGLLRRGCELLPYERLPNGKMPVPTSGQVFVRKDPKNKKKLHYLFLNPQNQTQVIRGSLDIDTELNKKLGSGKLTAAKLELAKEEIIAKIKENDEQNRQSNSITPFSHTITWIGGTSPVTYNAFTKDGASGEITLKGLNIVHGYKNETTNTFFYKPLGQPMEERSIFENRELFLAIESAIEKYKTEVSNGTQAPQANQPLIVEYETQGVKDKIVIEPLLIAQMTVDLKKGDPKPHCQMEITTKDDNSNILIAHSAFNENAKQYFENAHKQVNELEQAISKAEGLKNSVQKWTGRLAWAGGLGKWMGGIIGGQSDLNKTIKSLESMLTQERLANVSDPKIFDKISSLYARPEAVGSVVPVAPIKAMDADKTRVFLEAQQSLSDALIYPPASVAPLLSPEIKAAVVSAPAASVSPPAPAADQNNQSNPTNPPPKP